MDSYLSTSLMVNSTNSLTENSTNITQYRAQYRTHLTVWFAVVNTIAAFGAIGNLFLLWVIYRLRDSARRSGSHILLANLAFVYMVLCFPLIPYGSVAVYGGFAVPADYCRTQRSIGLLIYTVATWTDLALAVNRIYAIFFPRKFVVCCGKRMSTLVVVVVWLLGLAGTLPFWLDVAGHFQRFRLNECIVTRQTSVGKILVFTFLILPYGLTGLAALAVLVKGLMFRYGKWRSASVGAIQSGRNARQFWLLRRQLVIARTIFVSFLWCSLCVLPSLIAGQASPELGLRYPMLDTWLKTLVALGYAGSPLIFFKMNQYYRRGLSAAMADIHQRAVCFLAVAAIPFC